MLKRLLEEQEQFYTTAKARFNATGWSTDFDDFDLARTSVQYARSNFEIAKTEFDRHRQSHGAESGSGVPQSADAKIVISREALRMIRASLRRARHDDK